jgi:hypothetical protein
MASITKDTHQPPKSPFWIACFNGVGSNGKVRRLKRSTKTTDRKLAQKLADEWEQLEKLAGQGRLTESQCRKVIAQMYERTVGEPLHFKSTREYLAEWVESKKNETELRAFWKYRQIVDDFLAHLGSKADRLLREIAPADIRSWRDALKRKGLAQRDAGEKSFICPVNVIVGFVPLRFAEQARRILFVLEQTGVIEYVERGAPHTPGKPGKSGVWRYKRSMNE